jgi:ABC-type lipoprotein release transport system permease subunit
MLLCALTVTLAAWRPLPAQATSPDTGRSPTIGRLAPSPRSIAIDTRMAADLGLAPGGVVRLSAVPGAPGDSAVVSAVFARRADPAEVARREYRIRTHLGQLQSLLGADDRVDRFAVGVPAGVPVDSAVARINHVAFGFRAHPSKAVAVQSSRTFQVVERFHTAIGIITVVASAVFLLCLLLLSVEERKRDVAALRLLGISQGTVVRAIVIEAAIVSLVGSVLGAVIGWIASLVVNAHFQQLYRTPLLFALLTPQIFAFATLLSLGLGIGAGALAAWRLVRTPPLTLMGR